VVYRVSEASGLRIVASVGYVDNNAAAYSSGANCPVVLGRGKRLFEDGLATQWLTRLETNT
jgi:hypothetical protein